MKQPLFVAACLLSICGQLNAQDNTPWSTTGNIGIGTTTPQKRLEVTNADVAARMESTGGVINHMNMALELKRTTTGSMLDGFGPALSFYVRDNSAVDNPLGYIGMFRSGADNSGSMAFYSANAGSLTEKMRITNAGNVGIGLTTPNFLLHVRTNNTNAMAIQNTAALSATSGAFYRAYNSGLPNAANLRMGGIVFGVNSTGTTFYTSAQMEALSEGAWTAGSSYPSYLRFMTTSNGSGAPLERMRITSDGKIGIGTNAPGDKLEASAVSGNVGIRISNTGNSATDYATLRLYQNGSEKGAIYTNQENLYIQRSGTGNIILAGTGGNVGIGTTAVTDPTYKLYVEGAVRSRKVKVDQATWSDYVFDKTYKLPPLGEVEAYIQAHQHLPDVPSAAEVKREGLDLGDNQVLLLKKIEELTLYIIQQQKDMEELKAEMKDMKEKGMQKTAVH